MAKKEGIVKEHSTLEEFRVFSLFPDHQHRYESSEFRHVKDRFHEEHAKCWIDNGKCEGVVEIHHSIIEWAMDNGVDWEKVKKDHPNVSDVDDYDQMMPLCTKHHRGKYTGIHHMPMPEWEMQRYYTPEYLEKWEAGVSELLKKEAEEHAKKQEEKKSKKKVIKRKSAK